jgi:Zn-finger nucleic acid-binding protein
MAQIALHTSEILQHETRYGGIARCPGCAAVPITFAFFEVLIDWCGGCGGVWFDGGELADLRASIASLRRAGGGNAVLHFRQQAAEAVTIGTVRCRGCRAVTPLRETWMGEDGALCNACGHRFYYGIVAPDAAALAQIEAPTEGLGAGVLATLRRLLRA